jgi:hypothetical protein
LARVGTLDPGGDAVTFRIEARASLAFRPPPIPDPMAVRSSTVIDRIRGEYLEMPGLSPTLAQASRLFNMPEEDCRHVLDILLIEGFLRCSPDGQYRRR